jgi:hypothetical protein
MRKSAIIVLILLSVFFNQVTLHATSIENDTYQRLRIPKPSEKLLERMKAELRFKGCG